MGNLSLPPGFRFHPTDDELVGYYLKRRVDGLAIELEVIPVIDLYKFDPWQLPEKSFLPMRDMEWFFFCPRDKKYPNGSRTNRATASGYWKATSKDRKVHCESSVQGLRKTLVFYRGRAPGGERTDWVMHEYRLCEDLSQAAPNFLGAFALCRVVKRNELVQKTGDPQGESKGKRSLPSASASGFIPRKKVDSSEKSSCSPSSENEKNMLVDVQQQFVTGSNQTDFWGSEFLFNDPKDFNLEDDLLQSESSALPGQLPYSAADASSTISPVSSYSSLADDFFVVADELNGINGSLPCLIPSHHLHGLDAYGSVEDMALQNLEWEMSSYINQPTFTWC